MAHAQIGSLFFGIMGRGVVLATAFAIFLATDSLAQDAGVKFAGRRRGRWWQESPVTRESAKETVKTIARGMPGDSGVT